MGAVLQFVLRVLVPANLIRPALRPATRFAVGLVAVPVFRTVFRKCVKSEVHQSELEKDLEEWFRASVLLFFCTANVEGLLFGTLGFEPSDWLSVGLRILLTIGVIETMPDAQLFALMHPGPPAPSVKRGEPWWGLKSQFGPFVKGLLCQHLSRSSPVLAIMACVFGGVLDGNGGIPPGQEHVWAVGWTCYCAAITQYLVMGLSASREGAAKVLAQFDCQRTAERRNLVAHYADLLPADCEADEGSVCPVVPQAGGLAGPTAVGVTRYTVVRSSEVRSSDESPQQSPPRDAAHPPARPAGRQ